MEHLKLMILRLAKGEESIENVYQAICKEITEKVGSTRASVWLFNLTHDAIICQSLYDTRTKEYFTNIRLSEEDFPQYFEAVKHDLLLVADDAMSHPATSCFNEFYFEPLEIRSLLDVAVLNAGKLTAVLCCEHCEDIRNWTEEDIAYVRSMATVLSLTFRYKSTAA